MMDFHFFTFMKFLVFKLIDLVLLHINQLSFLRHVYPFLSNDQNKFKNFNFLVLLKVFWT